MLHHNVKRRARESFYAMVVSRLKSLSLAFLRKREATFASSLVRETVWSFGFLGVGRGLNPSNADGHLQVLPFLLLLTGGGRGVRGVWRP